MRNSPASSVEAHSAGKHAATASGASRWRLPLGALAIALLALIGAVVFLYPATASWLSQYDQSKVVESRDAGSGTTVATPRAEALAAAHAYNTELISGATIAANARKPIAESGNADADRYEALLRGDVNGAMGRLRIKSIDVDLPIYHGTSDETLAKGVGHLQGTSLRTAVSLRQRSSTGSTNSALAAPSRWKCLARCSSTESSRRRWWRPKTLSRFSRDMARIL